jgi:hypothetical protein
MEAQRASGCGGFAHSFHLLRGWQPPYPETTGYILPTMLRVHERHAITGIIESVIAGAQWLDAIQQPDGSFHDLAGQPQVFDTGQILGGWCELAERRPGIVDHDRLARAARWIVAQQETDGSFVRNAFHGRAHSYYARVGAALLAAGRLLEDDEVRAAGKRNLAWAMAQQQANGFFHHLAFATEQPYLHTMIYVAEGLLDGYAETREQAMFDAVLRFATSVLKATREEVPRSQYHSDFLPANRELCLPGLAQWAGLCLRLVRLGSSDFGAAADRAIVALKARQIVSADPRLRGGLFGSSPFWGRYLRLAMPNWGLKFFVDALLLADAAAEPV